MSFRFATGLRSDRAGSVAVEFGLLGPLMLGVLIAVFQVGLGMQSYNAVRSVAGDVARYAVVNYQTDNKLTTEQLATYGKGVATNAPYNLLSDDVLVVVQDAAVQRIAGAKELTITVEYQVPSILPFFGFESPRISFARPIFLIDS
jgi:Flp pilus assembly protein TadG